MDGENTKYPLLLHGNVASPIGRVEILDSVMRDCNDCELACEITPLITAKPNDWRIEAWSLNVIPSETKQTETRPDPALSRIQDDPRPITMITFPFQEPESPGLTVGCKMFGQEVTKILPYEEPGEMGYVTWYAIYGRTESDDRVDSMRLAQGITCKVDEIIYRIQAKYVESVGYQEEAKTE